MIDGRIISRLAVWQSRVDQSRLIELCERPMAVVVQIGWFDVRVSVKEWTSSRMIL